MRSLASVASLLNNNTQMTVNRCSPSQTHRTNQHFYLNLLCGFLTINSCSHSKLLISMYKLDQMGKSSIDCEDPGTKSMWHYALTLSISLTLTDILVFICIFTRVINIRFSQTERKGFDCLWKMLIEILILFIS